jgi:hypothetical protein
MQIQFDEGSFKQFEAVFKQLGINARRPWRFLNLAELILRQEVLEAYKSERSPAGRKWPPLAQSTIDNRKKRSKRRGRKGRSDRKGRKARAKGRGRFSGDISRAKRKGRRVRMLRDQGTMYRSLASKKYMYPVPAVAYGYADKKSVYHQHPGVDSRTIKKPPIRKSLPERWNQRMHAKAMQALVAQLGDGGVGRYLK